jgi:enoyl-CoA hydratase/carnithine racemase
LGGILTGSDGGLGIVTLDDPAGGNRLNPASLSALLDAVTRLAGDGNVRAVLLRSSGGSFCHGMDLAGLNAAHPGERQAALEAAVSTYVAVLTSIHDAPKPVLAVVGGSVKAGGVGLVSACDVVMVSEASTFELGEAFFGIIPANVLPFLLGLRIPLQKARYLILTARCLSAREAVAVGLADEVYPAAELERGLREVLKRIWRTSPAAAAEAKSFTRALLGMGLEDAKACAKDKLAELLAREEVVAAIGAFVQGGVPPWFAKWRPTAPLVLGQGDVGAGGAG